MSEISAQSQSSRPPVSAFLSRGFRPFFLLGALWAACAMAVWIAVLSGGLSLPSRFDPVSWHAHAFLFGYLGAIIAGFLLTALPNWTGRPALTGRPLVMLVLLWLAGRVVVAISATLPLGVVIAVDLGFPVVLGAFILREMIAAKNWRNLIVVAMLAALSLANLLFHLNTARGYYAAQGPGLRLGLAAALMMISVIGGRIIPTFTGNWLAKVGQNARPSPPMQTFDKIVLIASLVTLIAWVIWPNNNLTALALVVVSVLHAIRLVRWKGMLTGREPLVWVLHAGYACVPIGAAALGLSILQPALVGLAAAQHIWMAGAIGLMTLAVMTRATLGHSGRDLHAGPATVLIYGAVIGSVLMRLCAGVWPEHSQILYVLSGALWIGAFGGFAAFYCRAIILPKSASP